MNNDDYGNTIVNLIDDSGDQHDFEIVDEAEINGEYYAALMPHVEDLNDISEGDSEIYLFKVLEENGEEVFASIENDDEYKEVYAVFEQLFENLLFEDDEDETVE